MTDSISPITTTSNAAPACDRASPACAPPEREPAPVMPEPLPQSSCSADPAFAIGALYVQLLQTERSASRKNAVLEESRIQREVDKKIGDMRKAADERFNQSIVSGASKIVSGGLQATPGLCGLADAPMTEDGKKLYEGSAQATAGLGELGAGNYGREASEADRAAERHGSNAEAATRRRELQDDSGSDLRAQLERVLGYMRELEQARAQALSAAVFRV